jgi:5-methylcytosine-specific restriction endonuclease McrA
MAKMRMSSYLRGMCKRTIVQRRRETTYRMIAKKCAGKVPCFVCGEHVPYAGCTLEHIKPKSKGGTDDMSNLAISHFKCNQARGNNESMRHG